MKNPGRWILESAGMGMLMVSPLFIAYFFYSLIIAPLDRLGNIFLKFTLGKEMPFAGFIFMFLLFVLAGAYGRYHKSDWFKKDPTAPPSLLSLLIKGAKSGTVGLLVHSRKKGIRPPNVVLAPYYRKPGPWPFIILRVFPTSNPENPIVAGVFIDFPFLVKGGTISAQDRVFVDISFEEAFLFAVTSGAGLERFSRPPTEIILREHMAKDNFQNFMRRTRLP